MKEMSSPVEKSPKVHSEPDQTEMVSVVIPCYNEERFILKALEKLADQYDPSKYEIIVVDGLSDDGTRAVIDEFSRARRDISIRLIDNPARTIPAALNLGVTAAQGQIIARMDAHAVPSTGYIRKCVEVLGDKNIGAVGMPCRVLPGSDSEIARSISSAVSHPFGIGDAKYRLGRGGPPQEAVDTVAFACFRKSLWNEMGGFNEELLTNEDYDFNYRMRRSGKQVILDRSGHCDYFARSTLKSLATQYRRYGGWKAEMVRLQPRSLRLRHVIAPAFVASIILFAIIGMLWTPAWWVLLVELSLYVLAAFAAAVQIVIKERLNPVQLLLLPVVFATIHVTWGSSFLFRLLKKRL
jgi:glycosyltransferase involved in cell wall biosynthesis